jgi:superfamily II RNA helicase
MNTDTPRTNDAAFMAIYIDGNGVPTEFARQLERELAEVTEQRDGITLRLGQTQERMIDAERQRDRLAEALRKWDAACAAAEKCNAYQHSEQFKYRQWKTLSNRHQRLLADAESEKNEVLALIDSRKNA